MNSEELKEIHSMQSVVASYGIKINRAGFGACPFHNEKTPSMKVYKDSYHCFGCDASGDIFSFTQRINHCDFKTAFMMLGGTYEEPTFESKLALRKIEQEKKKRLEKEAELKAKKDKCNKLIDEYRDRLDVAEPLSDEWCECTDKLQILLYRHEQLNQ